MSESINNHREFDKALNSNKVYVSQEASRGSSRYPNEHHGGQNQQTVVFFAANDPANPYNWTTAKKTYVLITCAALVLNSTIGSALPSGASRQIQESFHLTDEALLVLPVSVYLIGYVLGPLVREGRDGG